MYSIRFRDRVRVRRALGAVVGAGVVRRALRGGCAGPSVPLPAASACWPQATAAPTRTHSTSVAWGTRNNLQHVMCMLGAAVMHDRPS